MEMEKKVSRSQPQPQDVIDLVEVFHLLLHKWKLLQNRQKSIVNST